MNIASFRVPRTRSSHLVSKFKIRRITVAVPLLVATLGLLGPNAVASSTHQKLTPLQRGLAFYNGKTITYIAGTGAGTGSDINSRAIAAEMGIYLHATINVENIPAGNGVAGEDQLASAVPNGLTIGYFDPGSTYSAILNNTPGLNFNIERETLLGGLIATPSILSTVATSPFTSFATLLHGDPSAMKVLGVTAGGASDEANLLFEIYGIRPDYIFGYSGNNALTTGFLRGDGNMVTGSPSQFQAQIIARSVRVLAILVTSKLTQGETWESDLVGVPTVTQLLKKYPPKTAHGRKIANYFQYLTSLDNVMLGTQSKTPPDDIAALKAADYFAVHSAPVKGELAARGSAWGYIPGPAEKATYINAIQHLSEIRTALAP